jgi:hypothetical protein
MPRSPPLPAQTRRKTLSTAVVLADQGQLIQHSVFIESGCRARLNDSVTQLSDAIYQAFLANIGTCPDQTDRY